MQESSESELLIELATPDMGGSLENPPTDNSESSSEEEVQPIPFRRSTRSKRLRPHCYLCDHETRRGVTVNESQMEIPEERGQDFVWRVE